MGNNRSLIIASGITTTAGASTVNFEGVTFNGTLRLDGTGGGTLMANTVGAANLINTTAEQAVDINTVTTNLSFASITGNGGGINAEGIVLNNLGANSSFTVTGTTSLDNYTGRAVRILNISENNVSVSFGQTDINTTVGQVAAGAQGVAIFTVSGTNFDFDIDALTVGNATDNSSRGFNVFSVTGAGADIDLASFTATNVATAFFINDFDAAGSTITVAGTTNITNAASDGVRIVSSSADVTFAGNTTITNNAANGDGVDIGTSAGGANTGTYSFAGLDVSVVGVGAFGLRATNSGTLNITNPLSFTNITSNNGTAVFINPTIVNATFQSLTSSNAAGGAAGIDLTLADGSTFTVTGSTNINSSTGFGVVINGQTGTQTVSLGTLNVNNGGAGTGGGLDINGIAGGTLNINTTAGSVKSGDEAAIDVLGVATSTITLGIMLGTIEVDGAADGIRLNTPAGGTINGTLNTGTGGFINNAGNGVQIFGTSGTVTIGQAITTTAVTTRLADIQGVTGGTVTLSGNLNGTGGTTGIVASNNTGGTIIFSGVSKIINTTLTGNGGITLASNTGATVSFTNGGLNVDTGSGTGFSATGGGTINVSGASNDITTGAGIAVLVTQTRVNATFAGITSSGSGTTGVDLTLLDGSTFTVTLSTNINGSTGNAVNIVGQTGTQTVSLGTLNVNNNPALAGGGLNVTNATAGTLTVNSTAGNINTGDDTAINIQNGLVG